MPVVLLAEDEPDIVRLVTYILRRDGFLVRTATTGQEAVAAARQGEVDLILLDIMLPELNGYGVCAALREDPLTRGIPIVVMSARAQAKEVARGLAAGAVSYITKPFEPAQLGEQIRAALAAAAAGRAQGGAGEDLHR
ncbi:MAG: response regulator [candidate division NC10 bacterium]|jgi:DNA-binding response OmpR family regulator|nr:response regulator [candidate division NC10 bacterium]